MTESCCGRPHGGGVSQMRTKADKGRVKNQQIFADVLYGRPLSAYLCKDCMLVIVSWTDVYVHITLLLYRAKIQTVQLSEFSCPKYQYTIYTARISAAADRPARRRWP